ncbi:MAG TPA: EamA family transporter [Terriglobales bacterium]|nr:EamA family transporter [Terriglobales bacterium]
MDRFLRHKTLVVSLVVIASNAFGNYTLTRGMRDVGSVVSISPLPYIHAMLDPWVIAGIVLLATWMVTRLALLSWADLSYVIMVTSTAYVLSALLAKVFLNERISAIRWVGIVLISAGAFIVARTFPSTAPEPEEPEE